MMTLSIIFRDYLRVLLTLVSITCIPFTAFSIEPVATIGQPIPEKHVFINNNTILRTVRWHIEKVDVTTGDVLEKFGDLSYYNDVVFSPSVKQLAILNYTSASRITTVSIWDVNQQQQISEWEIPSRIDDDEAVFSPTEPILATYLLDEIQLWNWKTGEIVGQLIRENLPSFRTMVFSADGNHLIIASRDNLEMWNIKTKMFVGHFFGRTFDSIDYLTISPNGKTVAASDRNTAYFYVWDIDTMQQLLKEKTGIGRTANMKFSPNSQYLYVATKTGVLSKSGLNPWVGWDDKVCVWDVNLGQKIATFDTEFPYLEAINLSPDGKLAHLHYNDAEVIWNIEKNRKQEVWADFVRSWFRSTLGMSPDGKTVILVSRSYIKSWDVDSQQMRLLISAEDYNFEGLAFSPDNKLFAVGKNPWLQLRNIKTGKVELQFPDYIGYTEQIEFSPSGRWIAVVNDFSQIQILDVNNPKKRQLLNNRIGPDRAYYHNVTFSKDDKFISATVTTKSNNDETKYWMHLWKREGDFFKYMYAWRTSTLASSPVFTTIADGSTVIAATIDKEINIWKVFLNTTRHLTTLNGEGPLHFSPDSRYLYSNQDENLQIWDWQKSRPIHHTSHPEYVSVSQDGSRILSYKKTGQYEILDLTDVISLLPYPVEPKGKQLVTFGKIKRNQLMQNYPNPFNPETWIPFRLADESNVQINIYSPTGKLIRSITTGTLSAGEYSSQSKAVYWDGRNDKGELVGSGIYFYTINTGNFSATRKMLIRK